MKNITINDKTASNCDIVEKIDNTCLIVCLFIFG